MKGQWYRVTMYDDRNIPDYRHQIGECYPFEVHETLTLFHAGDFFADSMRGGSDLTPWGIIGLGVWNDPGIIRYH